MCWVRDSGAMLFLILPLLIALPSTHAFDPVCPLVLDGRIPPGFSLQTFDRAGPPNPFNPQYVKSKSLPWSRILKFPQTIPSVFDLRDGHPLEITITDKSIYESQTGMRRAGLLFNSNSGTDDQTNAGVKTFHWSVHQPVELPHRPLNLSHEYLNVWHETLDYNGRQFQFQTGALVRREDESPFTFWKILNREKQIVWSVLMDFREWQNFAVTLDFVRKYVGFYALSPLFCSLNGKMLMVKNSTMRVFYSKGTDDLKPVTDAFPNNNSGKGRFQVGILKKSTEYTNELKDGFQEDSFEESQIYGGIFVEDSSKDGCVTR
jgi:hypothetical protein